MQTAPRSMEAARQVARRALVRLMVAHTGRAVSMGCAASLAMIGAAKVWALPEWWNAAIFLPPVVGAIVGMTTAWRERWSVTRSAAAADEVLASGDAVRSAIELSTGANDPFAALAIERGEEAANRVVPARVVTRLGHVSWAWCLALAGASAAVWVFVPSTASERETNVASAAHVAAAVQDLRAAAAAVRPEQDAATNFAGPTATEAAELKALEQELSAGRMDPNAARAKAAEALQAAADREEQRQRALQGSAEKARARLAEAASRAQQGSERETPSELRRALSKGDVAAAAEAVERMRQAAPRLSAEERTKLADDLDDLASAVQKQEREAGAAADAPGDEAGDVRADERERIRDDSTNTAQPKQDLEESLRDASKALREAAKKPENKDEAPGTKTEGEHRDRPQAAPKTAPKGSAGEGTKPPGTSAQREPNSGEAPKSDGASQGDRKAGAKPTNGDATPRSNPNAGGDSKESGTQQGDETKGGESTHSREERPQPGPPNGETKNEGQSTGSPTKDAPKVTPPSGAGEQGKRRAEPSETGAKEETKGNASPADRPTRGKDGAKEGEHPPQTRPSQNGENPTDKTPATDRPDEPAKPLERNGPPGAAPKMDESGRNADSTRAPGTPKTTAPEASRSPDGSVPKGGAPSDSKGEERPKSEAKREGQPKDEPGAERKSPGELPNLPNTLPPIPKMSDEALEQLAKRFRDMGKNLEKNPPSQQQIERLRRQAQELLEKSTPEQRERLERLAEKLAKDMPQDKGSDGGGPGPRMNEKERESERTSRKELAPGDATTDERGASDNRPGDASFGGERSNAGREAKPRRIGPTPTPWTGETETVDARPKTVPEGSKPRLLAEVLNPDATGRKVSAGEGSLDRELREAAKGAERAIEQQGVPNARSEYIRRVFRRYVERTSSGGTTTPAPSPAKDAPTPDAADASQDPKK